MNRIKSIVAIFLLSISLASCNTVKNKNGFETYKPRNTILVEIPLVPEESKRLQLEEENEASDFSDIEIDVIDYITDEREKEDPLDRELSDSQRVINNTKNATITPKQETFRGGAVVYNYVENSLYKVFCVPHKTTDIMLEPGETIVSSPVIGDPDNFVIGNSFAMKDNIKQEVINILPVYPYLKTSLTIYTNRRTYKVMVESFKETYMPLVSFNYPLTTFKNIQRNIDNRESQIWLNCSVSDLDFTYDIVPMSIHKPAWLPSTVFSANGQTYIYFPSAESASWAPVLFEIDGRSRVLLNYRVQGRYYIVDQVIRHAQLILDTNNQNIVSIIKGGR